MANRVTELVAYQALEQFEVYNLSVVVLFQKYNIFITGLNITVVLEILVILFCFFFLFRTNCVVFFNNFFIYVKLLYCFVLNIIINQTGGKGELYFPSILTMFFLILFGNLIGLIPNNFCITSQIFVTFLLSFSVFIGVIILSIRHQKLKFLLFFVPRNVPTVLVPFLTCIEIVSYISRVFSLSIRLFANMVAGHALLHIISGSVVFGLKKLFLLHVLLSLLVVFPLFILVAIVGLEIGIAFLQAYVFIVLCSIYLNDIWAIH